MMRLAVASRLRCCNRGFITMVMKTTTPALPESLRAALALAAAAKRLAAARAPLAHLPAYASDRWARQAAKKAVRS